MPRGRAIISLAVGLALLATAPVASSWAQVSEEPRVSRGRPGFGSRPPSGQAPSRFRRDRKINPSPMILLQMALVQEELKLTPEQIIRIRRTNDEFNRRRTESVRAISGPKGI